MFSQLKHCGLGGSTSHGNEPVASAIFLPDVRWLFFYYLYICDTQRIATSYGDAQRTVSYWAFWVP